jgi:hypothetical protein
MARDADATSYLFRQSVKAVISGERSAPSTMGAPSTIARALRVTVCRYARSDTCGIAGGWVGL